RKFSQIVQIATGGAAPPSAVIAQMEAMGFAVTHLYGLTESFGPSTVCMWQPELDTTVPADGATMGELMLRGNTVMMGYLKNSEATAQAFAGGWFHTGDLAVQHPD